MFSKLVLPHDDLGADVHPAIEIDDVVVDQPEAAGRDRLTVFQNNMQLRLFRLWNVPDNINDLGQTRSKHERVFGIPSRLFRPIQG